MSRGFSLIYNNNYFGIYLSKNTYRYAYRKSRTSEFDQSVIQRHLHYLFFGKFGICWNGAKI